MEIQYDVSENWYTIMGFHGFQRELTFKQLRNGSFVPHVDAVRDRQTQKERDRPAHKQVGGQAD